MQAFALILTAVALFDICHGVSVDTLNDYARGVLTDDKLEGFLHVGRMYSTYIHKPKAGDNKLTVEIYLTKTDKEVRDAPQPIQSRSYPLTYVIDQVRKYQKHVEDYNQGLENDLPGSRQETLEQWIEARKNADQSAPYFRLMHPIIDNNRRFISGPEDYKQFE